MTTSGTYDWSLNNADILLEAFDRCEIRPPAITGEHMISGRRSLNLELQRWANLVPLLWAVDLQTISLVQGVTTYSLPQETVTTLDVYLRTFQLTNTFNVSPDFSTTINSSTITAVVANHGLQGGYWVNIVTPIAIGNLLLQGFYEVVDVINSNSFTFSAASNASSTIANSGTAPEFTTASGSADVTVTLANHDVDAGSLFNVGVQTEVGGVTLFGGYTVLSVTSSSEFVIATQQVASSTESVFENDGDLQMQGQDASVAPIDRIMTPMGRTDYSMIANKFTQAPPTTYWFDRTLNPTITLWQVPDGNGPYQLRYYRMRRIQDANPKMGQTPDIPYMFIDALCSCVAERLAVKYAKAMLETLASYAKRALDEALTENRERAPIYITPSVDSYWNF